MNNMPDKRSKARILVVTGPGKGKTTAAIGMAVRSLAHGKRVLLVRFAKMGDSGELAILGGFENMTILNDTHGMFPKHGSPDFAARAQSVRDLFERARALASANDVLIMDEICGVVAHGMLEEEPVLELLAALEPNQTAILTGRNAKPRLLAVADTVSEIECVKHGYRRGIAAEAGVEF